jgi:hypothetical protein
MAAVTNNMVIVVGVNTVTELFLLSAKEFAPQVHVAEVIAEETSVRGRAIHQKPVLGTVEELQDIHGVAVDRIFVATPANQLRPRSLVSWFRFGWLHFPARRRYRPDRFRYRGRSVRALFEYRTVGAPTDERDHHRLSKCPTLLNPNQKCETLNTNHGRPDGNAANGICILQSRTTALAGNVTCPTVSTSVGA